MGNFNIHPGDCIRLSKRDVWYTIIDIHDDGTLKIASVNTFRKRWIHRCHIAEISRAEMYIGNLEFS